MTNRKPSPLLLLFFLLFSFSGSFAQVKIDTSALSVFWELVDTLSLDKQPSKILWKKFALHPAYAQIERSGNRVFFLKKILPIVFMPSKAARLEALMDGAESPYQYFAQHLIDVKAKRKPLENYLRRYEFDVYLDSYLKSLEYLPTDIKPEEIKLTVYLALFEDNGFGGEVITIDLLHLMKGSTAENRDFFAHEFHHSLRSRSKKYTLYDPDTSQYYPIIQALKKMPLEGVASLLDKRKYFQPAYYNDSLLNDQQRETVEEFSSLVRLAPSNLAKIDSILGATLKIEEKGKAIFQQLPWGGHTIGYYMADAIEKAFGKAKLIEAQYSCLAFFFLYQDAALRNENLYQFSEETIAFLKTIGL
ncbi:MAG: DUF5700 domain-containing putative Zn-dependent protease [Bacteroidota bacterium]